MCLKCHAKLPANVATQYLPQLLLFSEKIKTLVVVSFSLKKKDYNILSLWQPNLAVGNTKNNDNNICEVNGDTNRYLYSFPHLQWFPRDSH